MSSPNVRKNMFQTMFNVFHSSKTLKKSFHQAEQKNNMKQGIGIQVVYSSNSFETIADELPVDTRNENNFSRTDIIPPAVLDQFSWPTDILSSELLATIGNDTTTPQVKTAELIHSFDPL